MHVHGLIKLVWVRNPTLTYTSRLENRIQELEAELAIARSQRASTSADLPFWTSSPPSIGVSEHSTAHSIIYSAAGGDSSVGAGESFKGVKVDNQGGITYHGTTSFFQLPNESARGSREYPSSLSNQAVQRRERLVANAWQQRVLENYSDIPVRGTFGCGKELHGELKQSRNLFNTFLISTGAGFNLFSTSFIGQLSHVSS